MEAQTHAALFGRLGQLNGVRLRVPAKRKALVRGHQDFAVHPLPVALRHTPETTGRVTTFHVSNSSTVLLWGEGRVLWCGEMEEMCSA